MKETLSSLNPVEPHEDYYVESGEEPHYFLSESYLIEVISKAMKEELLQRLKQYEADHNLSTTKKVAIRAFIESLPGHEPELVLGSDEEQ